MVVRLFFSLVIIYLLYKIIKGIFPSFKKTSIKSNQSVGVMEDLMEDPNCHAYVPLSNAYQASVNGQKIYFCSKKCFLQYKSNRENRGTEEAQ
jgi:YHS domain-containing protein